MITQSEYRRLKTRLSRLENKLHRCTGYPGAPNYCLPIVDEDDPRVPIYRAIGRRPAREGFVYVGPVRLGNLRAGRLPR